NKWSVNAPSAHCRDCIRDPFFARCVENPAQFIDLRATRHVLDVTGPAARTGSLTHTLSLTRSFSHDSSEMENWSTGESVGTSKRIGVSIGTGGLGYLLKSSPLSIPLSFIGAEAGWSKSWNTHESHDRSRRHGRGESASASETVPLAADEISLSFRARVKRCALVRGIHAEKDRAWVHACESGSAEINAEETWFLLAQAGNGPSILRDSSSREENLLLQTM